jgi:fluoride ion exporter CrcB/FEX
MLDLYLAYELKRYRAVVINLSASITCGLIAAALGYGLAS